MTKFGRYIKRKLKQKDFELKFFSYEVMQRESRTTVADLCLDNVQRNLKKLTDLSQKIEQKMGNNQMERLLLKIKQTTKQTVEYFNDYVKRQKKAEGLRVNQLMNLKNQLKNQRLENQGLRNDFNLSQRSKLNYQAKIQFQESLMKKQKQTRQKMQKQLEIYTEELFQVRAQGRDMTNQDWIAYFERSCLRDKSQRELYMKRAQTEIKSLRDRRE